MTLKFIKKEHVPFNSETKRFDSEGNEKQKDPSITKRGPGYYNHHQINQLKPKKSNYDYFTAERRFEHGSYLDHYKDLMPGPGYYDSKVEPRKANKSFNLMFN